MSEPKEKFSYSKLSTYESCPWRYKLQYVDKHFLDTSNIANEFGTLVHYVEETIAKDILDNDGEPLFLFDEEKYINLFINSDITETDGSKILGVKKIKEKYPEDFYKKDKNNLDYSDKANDYLNFGIYRLRDYLNENRNLEIVGIEQPFELEYRNYVFKGFIDRVFRDKNTGQLLIEDIKTWTTIDQHDLVTPLQFVIYTLAAKQIYNVDDIKCFYELPLIVHEKFLAGSSGYINRGLKKIDKLLDSIESQNFDPKPSPLCYWCVFSHTFPNQPEEAKYLCPYFCHWTRDNKDFSVEYEWMGIENNDKIIEDFKNKSTINSNQRLTSTIYLEPLSLIDLTQRKFIFR